MKQSWPGVVYQRKREMYDKNSSKKQAINIKGGSLGQDYSPKSIFFPSSLHLLTQPKTC